MYVGKFKGATSDNDLSLDDLSELLHSVDHDKVVNSDGQIISDEALAALLDRTVRTKPVTVSPDQGSDTSKVAGEGTSHSGVFKVLEEIGNVVHSKEESEDKKGSGSVQCDESSSNDENKVGAQDSTLTASREQTADSHTEGMKCEVAGLPVCQSNGHELPSALKDLESKKTEVKEHEKALTNGHTEDHSPSVGQHLEFQTGEMECEGSSASQSNGLIEEDPPSLPKDSESGKMECETTNSLQDCKDKSPLAPELPEADAMEYEDGERRIEDKEENGAVDQPN